MNQITLFREEKSERLKFKVDKGCIVTNAECGPTPPGEVVLRSAFCNLRCIPCFAYNYSWPEKAKINKDVIDISVNRLIREFLTFFSEISVPGNKPSYNWFRILGGEPFLNKNVLKGYVDFLKNIPNDVSSKFNRAVLIQTNGIMLGITDKEELKEIFNPLKDKSFKIVIEVSIKGSNSEEFRIITQTHKDIAMKFYDAHLTACETIEYIHTYVPNIDWTAVAGFGIGVSNLVAGNFHRKEYIKTFYHPETDKPFYHPDCWDKNFKRIHDIHVKKYRNEFGDKFPMFGIEDRRNWRFALCGLRNCKKYGGKYFYDGYQVYRQQTKPKNVELEQNLYDMLGIFFFGDPPTTIQSCLSENKRELTRSRVRCVQYLAPGNREQYRFKFTIFLGGL